MKRKVIQIAGSTHLISMPKDWITRRGIKKGDELDVRENGNELIISNEDNFESLQTVIDVTGLDRTSIVFSIRSAYRKGYDTIEIKYEKNAAEHFRVGETKKISQIVYEEVGRLVGVEVIQHKENSCTVKTISETRADDFNNILRRIFILLKDLSKDLSSGFATNNKELLDTIKEKHDNITKFISYSLRLLNKTSRFPPVEKTLMYQTISFLETIVDVLKWCGRRGLDLKTAPNKKTAAMISRVMQSIDTYYDFFYKFDRKKITELYKHRHETKDYIEKNLKGLPVREVIIVVELVQVLDTIVSLTEIKLSLEQNETTS